MQHSLFRVLLFGAEIVFCSLVRTRTKLQVLRIVSQRQAIKEAKLWEKSPLSALNEKMCLQAGSKTEEPGCFRQGQEKDMYNTEVEQDSYIIMFVESVEKKNV